MEEPAAGEAILVAVAVHDDEEARIEAVDLRRVRVPARRPAHLRVSYRLADSARRREAAILKVKMEFDGEPMAEKEAAMHDRPLMDDEAQGDLRFETPSLRPGLHKVRYTVHLEVSDETIEVKPKHTGAARTLQGTLELEAVEE